MVVRDKFCFLSGLLRFVLLQGLNMSPLNGSDYQTVASSEVSFKLALSEHEVMLNCRLRVNNVSCDGFWMVSFDFDIR